jgi:hypothetical protein
MAYDKDQNEPKLPISKKEKRYTSDLLPRFYRTKSNKKFLQATLDQLTQPGTVKKLNGFVGRQTAKATTAQDIYIEAVDKDRQDYQFEPSAVITDYLGNTVFYKDYLDHINHIETFDGNIANHSRLNAQEFYSWNPHICWDKFVNYQQYYWLPFGPPAIEILGQQLEVQSTFTVKGVDEEDNIAYLFTPNGLTRNPTLKLFRGQTYRFDIDSEGHPFSIKRSRVAGDADRYEQGISEYGVEKGIITFTIPNNCPDVLFYVSENAVDTGGVIQVFDIEENTEINLERDFLGKKEYIVPNGTAKGLKISNGMKLSFGGNVTPSKYAEGFWYVEGVGSFITLTSEKDLEIKASYKEETEVLFDDVPFDQLPFGDTSLIPNRKDYITVNRSSVDKNPWSRYNRWFHQDVIKESALASKTEFELDQSSRATRPIIEFCAGLKLHNHGLFAKKDIDLIDSFTKDVFSTVEGSSGYNVDGVDLQDGMRIIFTADTDSFVKNKIFKVNFIEVAPPSRIIDFDANTGININADTVTFNTEHGLSTGNRITYLTLDNPTVLGLVNRKIYYVKLVDTFVIELYLDQKLTKKVDIFAPSSGTHRFEVYAGSRRQINLVEEEDAVPRLYETVSVNYGQNENLGIVIGNQGQSYWFNGSTWKLSQIKTEVNQPPLFDIFDKEGISYSDFSKYDGSTFVGTKVFSYKVGNGSNDKELGFPLAYQNINNIGDIVFEFNLLTDSFAYKNISTVVVKNTDVGYLKLVNAIGQQVYENAWIKSEIVNSQPVVRVFKDSGLTNNFPIDVFDNLTNLEDLEVRVYVNGKRISKDSYSVQAGVVRPFVLLDNAVSLTDVITLKCFSNLPKNQNGYYEIPGNLQNNPANNNIEKFTLGQVIDHVDSIIDNLTTFQGNYPGQGNLRDLGNISTYGTRFVQHSGSLNLALYHFGSKSANVIKSLAQARIDYGKFKRSFIVAATESGIDADPKRHVDYILQIVNKDKPKTNPYYLSDMFGYTASNRIAYEIFDARIKTYPLNSKFSINELSNKSVNIYLNGEQLLHGIDYVFGDDVFFELLIDVKETDLLEAYEYETTDGCFCPPTPTKLGLYPLFEPMIYIDDTYVEPTKVIRGHDGSITIAFEDYRDDLILELEKRIYNNVKVKYDTEIFDIYNYIPGYERTVDYSKEEFDRILSKFFFQWTINIPQDYTKHLGYDRLNPFTYNYRGSYTLDGASAPAHWRGIYRWLFDTDTPHITPWECLGFSIEPTWWQQVYGPAPYTNDNNILWDDIRLGIIREPGVPVKRNKKFARSILDINCPVDDQGKLLAPYDLGFLKGPIVLGEDGYFEFGDVGVVESTWRRSSYYAFALIEALLLMKPNEVLGRCLDRSRIVKNLNSQLVYSNTGLRLRLEDLILPSISLDSERIYAAGLVNYIVDYLTSPNLARIEEYKSDLKNLKNKMSIRTGSFTNKPKYKILLDSKNPSSSGGVFVPEENYNIFLNVSSSISKVIYSGVLVTKFPDGFEIRGYNFDNPYFYYYGFNQTEKIIKVGGISESYLEWESDRLYVAGKIVRSSGAFYRVKTTHTSGSLFDTSLYARLPELPIVGGREVAIRTSWDTSDIKVISYGTRLATIQDVADFLQGYGVYLEKQGFVFDEFDNNLRTINNWETSVKEFCFWTTQGWTEGSIISLSPAAKKLVFKSNLSVVEDVTDPFYGYNIFRVDGQKIDPEFLSIYRSQGEFVLEPENTNHGIYGAVLHLVQKEHVVCLDNKTLFNDTIYDPEAGYRQERVKILGYVASEWTGGFDIPGFIYDSAEIQEWEPWTDYNLGDIVKYKEFYYSSKKFLVGTEKFVAADWVLLEEKPVPQLLSNLDYRAEQFTDFYDLDTDNFDSNQQKVAQHLIGYQNRQYLENIIQNDVSQYKFYQGMIIEKGTQNVLTKLFDVLSVDNQESLTFDEEWAFRVGEFGAVDTFEEVEFLLQESEFKINPQPLELVTVKDNISADFIFRQTPSDIYVKPQGYNNNLWPEHTKTNFLRTAGYVSREDIKEAVDNISDMTTRSIDSFKKGDYIWAGFEGRSWNVYRINQIDLSITDAAYENGTVTITCNKIIPFSAGTIVAIVNNDKLKGFHKVTTVTLRTFNFEKTVLGWEGLGNELPLIYVLEKHRVETIDNANSIIPKNLAPGEIIWTDDNGSGKWAVYKNSNVYSKTVIENFNPANDLEFGKSLTIDSTGNIAAVSDDNGITVFEKTSSLNTWKSRSRVPNPIVLSENLEIGKTYQIFSNGDDPTVPTYTGVDFVSVGASSNDVGTIFVATGSVSGNGSAIRIRYADRLNFSKNSYWLAVSSDVESDTGTISVYRLIGDNNYRQPQILTKFSTETFGQFGDTVTFSKKESTSEFFDSLLGTYQGLGSSAKWNVIKKGSVYSPIITDRGFNYSVGDIIVISGSLIGGDNILNDLTITVAAVDDLTGEILNFDYSGKGPEDKEFLYVSEPLASKVHVYEYTETTDQWEFVQTLSGEIDSKFGYKIASDFSGNNIAISAPAALNDSGKVFVYTLDLEDDSYSLTQELTEDLSSDKEQYGVGLALSASGKFLAVSSTGQDVDRKVDVGQVFVYELASSEFNNIQTIDSPRKEAGERFGETLSFMNDDKTLVVVSALGDTGLSTIFDQDLTIFDKGGTRILDNNADSGRVDIFDRYNSRFIFGESLETQVRAGDGYGKVLAVGNNTILTSAIYEEDSIYENSGLVYSYVKPTNTYSWTVFKSEDATVDVTSIKKAYLYDRVDNKLITYLDVVDLSQGKIPGPADQEIKYKTYYDPAIYSVGTEKVNVDSGENWNKKHVGMLWWDLTRARTLNSHGGGIVSKTAIWNKLYDTASIDVYEWVESSLTPAAWNKIADTEKGLTQGVSGTTKYGDEIYSVSKKYDSISQSFKETYYFWVKGRKIVPNVEGRQLNSFDVANLIADPIAYGYPCIGFVGTNTVIMANLQSYINDGRTVLSIQYWVDDNKNINAHSEWKLLSTNRNTNIPKQIEDKWFDSLAGKDKNDRVVPDLSLPVKQKYGIEFKPRQSMFVNRTEALKQFIERTNSVLKNNLIADDYDLSDLELFEPMPGIISAQWDETVDTDEELRFVSTSLVDRAILKPIVVDGKISQVAILNSGYGYGKLKVYQVNEVNDPVSWLGPTLEIVGSGINAVVFTVVNLEGRIIDTVIKNSGEGYDSLTTIKVRPFTVLVKNDSQASGIWSLYFWDIDTLSWTRSKCQSYDVRKYWKYIDWYDEGYNQFVKIDYLVENTYQLVTTEMPVGSIAKVKNVGSGGWLLLEKYDNLQTIDYTLNFKVIGRGNGTIEFLDSLYKFKGNTLGYDGPLFDSDIYDNTPAIELRIILESIKNKILVDEFKVNYLELFFSSVRYAIQEQTFVDWAFKTSFVKSQHNVGELKQKVTYNSDNLEFFESYIKEVKPYRTKVREYVSNYSKLDNVYTSTEDFDLLPVINDELKVLPLTVQVNDTPEIVTDFNEISRYPWKAWADNIGFEITDIIIVDSGEGYVNRPVITISGLQLEGGEPADAKAYISNGRLTRIELVSAGTKWVKAPTVSINGGLSEQGRSAKLVAIIGNSLPRSNHLTIKFDRLSKTYEIEEITQVEDSSVNPMLIGNGSRTEFPLRYSPDIKIGESFVTVDGIEILSGGYTLETVVSHHKGYTSYSGLLKLDQPPALGSEILIEYKKDFKHLSATDRIKFYYDPKTGQLGKDYGQLMTGVDYGGVAVTGIDFKLLVGWDALPWFSDYWDFTDPTLDDYLVNVGTVPSYSYRMPYVPAKGEQITVYVSSYESGNYNPSIRVDDPDYLTINQKNKNAQMKTFVGDGEVDIIVLPETLNLQNNDRIIFRKITSDGSSGLRDIDFDTRLSGGDLAYVTATGVAPEDILLDGDDLISSNTSHAPEEVVPGHIVDTLAIKVYHRPSGGCPNIMFNNHRGNGETVEFAIGQYYPTASSIIVRQGSDIKNINVDYTLDYNNNSVIFSQAPAHGELVSIISFGFNSESILDLDYFVSDGQTLEYLTKAPWVPTISGTVLIDGALQNYEFFSTDENYTNIVGQTWRSRVGIRFAEPPPAGSIINYIISDTDIETTSSIVRSETVIYGTESTYNLTNLIGDNNPLELNVLVKTGEYILKPSSASYFEMLDGSLDYALKDHRYAQQVVSSTDIEVYKENLKLERGADYIVDFDNKPTTFGMIEGTLLISQGGLGYTVGDVLEVQGGVLDNSGSPAQIEVTQVDSSGTVRFAELIYPGDYVTQPSEIFAVSQGTGIGAMFTGNFEITRDSANITIKVDSSIYEEGKKLVVLVTKDADYFINSDNSITFTDSYDEGTAFTVLSFYNHNVLGIERTVDRLQISSSIVPGTAEFYELNGKFSGKFSLRDSAVSGDFVWVVKNGQLLVNNIDYYLDSDRKTVVLEKYILDNDVIQIIAFTNVVVEDSFAYMQFKDMLNRTHYKRLNRAKSTTLDRDLNQFDTTIKVLDGSKLDKPNPSKNLPGIIEVNGERIEYFVKKGNVLSQLRRGTLGTGIPYFHSKGTVVNCMGKSETIPYKDEFVVNSFVSDGSTRTLDLPYIPLMKEIFGKMTVADVEVFVGGVRLKKSDYKIYAKDLDGTLVNPDWPDSPEGDISLPQAFTSTGAAQITLASAPEIGVKILVVKKQGKLWNDPNRRLAKSDTPVAKFLTEVGADWPESAVDKYENRVLDVNGNPIQTGDGDPLEY